MKLFFDFKNIMDLYFNYKGPMDKNQGLGVEAREGGGFGWAGWGVAGGKYRQL